LERFVEKPLKIFGAVLFGVLLRIPPKLNFGVDLLKLELKPPDRKPPNLKPPLDLNPPKLLRASADKEMAKTNRTDTSIAVSLLQPVVFDIMSKSTP
jgi:hypothetical protein